MTRFIMARMPMNKQPDSVLYGNGDGRYIDGRTDPFPAICVKSLREAGALEEIINVKKVLDVGSGTGQLCRHMASMGTSEYTGIEPIKVAHDRSGIADRCTFINGYATDISDTFDVVMSWHVIEHVDDPEAFMAALFARCKTGGMVVIATPNASSIFARSRNWRCKESFHTYLLDKRTLSELIEEAGGKVEKTMTWGGFQAPRSMIQDIANKLAKLTGHGDVQLVIARKA